FHPHRKLVDQPGRALVLLSDNRSAPAWRPQEPPSLEERHPRVDQAVERRSQAVRMEENRRGDPDLAQPIYLTNFRRRTLVDRLPPEVITVRHNLLSPTYRPYETDIFTFARRQGLGVVIKQVLAQGLLTGSHNPDHPPAFGPGDHRAHKAWFTPAGL